MRQPRAVGSDVRLYLPRVEVTKSYSTYPCRRFAGNSLRDGKTADIMNQPRGMVVVREMAEPKRRGLYESRR